MPVRSRPAAILLAACALAAGLSGCGTINEKVSAGMGDYIPQWAGGLPADAPPRPGTLEYDAWMKDRERKRMIPAGERDKDGQSQPAAGSSAGAVR